MNGDKDQHEPSMEEILASIRQIISEDGDESPQQAGEAPYSAANPGAGPLDLTQVVNEDGSVTNLETADRQSEADPVSGSEAGGSAYSTDPTSDVGLPGFAEPATGPEPWVKPPETTLPPAAELVSPEGASAVQSALLRLSSQTRVRGEVDPATLEGLVTELLKPMLKQWLDANLPRTVERLVREEIERIAKRAG